ncbi:hypothetical protein K504DRAFT_465534 [Pleomassaria siparia CBS 279.74]|uniref:Uncharacterized protein n=1 Tax=Pleomassaria siparia CBS 279.74 TaxID=1314801 RepID=A0A6G1KHG4_9PLEO|nr:hypothetical protein K504DRAFT_465534 [Pleomassaria siparia CBS 279.74]
MTISNPSPTPLFVQIVLGLLTRPEEDLRPVACNLQPATCNPQPAIRPETTRRGSLVRDGTTNDPWTTSYTVQYILYSFTTIQGLGLGLGLDLGFAQFSYLFHMRER